MRRTTWSRLLPAAALVPVAAIALAACAPAAPFDAAPGATTPVAGDSRVPEAATIDPAPEADTELADQLRYLIEEEKLAFDVYLTLGEAWDLPIFDRIARSETTHQDEVARLLEDYGIEDPRLDEVGAFVDADLQRLYDDLVASGLASVDGAIEAGLTIERTDVEDLSAAIPGAPADVTAVLERLLAGSQSHLAAFERQ